MSWSHTCLPPDLPDAGEGACCIGAAMGGAGSCTCWEPVVPPQADPLPSTDLEVRVQRCIDCAFRPDSPEREDGSLDTVLEQILRHPDRPFFCHQGLTPITKYRHPSGVTYDPRDLPSNQGKPPMDYQPRVNAAGRPCKDDGSQQDVCAGWAAERDRARRSA